jgi:hypothetical protein
VSGLPILRAPQSPCPGSHTVHACPCPRGRIAHGLQDRVSSSRQYLDTSRNRSSRVAALPVLRLESSLLFIPDRNPIESPFAAVRLRTTAAKRFKRVKNATAVIWKTLLVAEQTFLRLDAPELLADVANGIVYVNGVRQQAEAKLAAA